MYNFVNIHVCKMLEISNIRIRYIKLIMFNYLIIQLLLQKTQYWIDGAFRIGYLEKLFARMAWDKEYNDLQQILWGDHTTFRSLFMKYFISLTI